MKRNLFLFSVFAASLILLLAIAVFVEVPLDPYLDFQVLYRADSGILQGIPLYDQAAQTQMIADDLGVSVNQVFVLPFPYPPWFAVTTLPLALLSIDVAVRMWFWLNVVMLLLSVWLLTNAWEPRKRLYSFLAAFFFLPIFGALIVGQYVFPSLLGMALILYALRHQQVGLLALGMGLATFKPHIGMFVLIPVFSFLLLRRDAFGRRAAWATVLTGMILFFLGFLADGRWPITYLQALFSFKDVSQCGLCVSMPLTIAQAGRLGFDQSIWIAGILLAALIALFIGSKYRMCDDLSVAFFVCMALLINPYLQNYDFAFALVPLFYLVGSASSKRDWLWITWIFFLPWIGLGLLGRAGTPTLLVSVIAMTLIILTRLYKKHTIAL